MADDDLNRLLIESQNVLGTNVRVPFQGQGDLAASAAGGLPAPAATGQGQSGGGRAIPGAGGAAGLPDLSKLLKGMGGTDLGTRGDTGGVSLSDLLRSLQGASGLGAPGTGGIGSIAGQAGAIPFGTIDTAQVNQLFQQGFTGDQIKEIMGGLEAVSSGAQGVGGAVPGTAEAATSGVSGLGGAAGGAGILSAILGLIASQTGNKDLGMAANAVGDVAGVAGTAAAAPAAFAGAEAAAGGAAVGSAAAGGASAIGGAAGLAFAPVAAALLIDSIMQMAGSKDAPDLIGSAMEGTQGNYPFFNKGLVANEGQQGQAFNTLAQALPYVQNKEELGQLLNTMKHYETSTTGAPLTGGQEGVYNLQTIPGTGPITHGQQTPAVDWGPQTAQFQSIIDQLMTTLPGDPITATYGQPGGALEGDAAMRLWTQFLPRGDVSPVYLPQAIPGSQMVIGAGGEGGGGMEIPLAGLPSGWHAPGDLHQLGVAEPYGAVLRYGDPAYPYNTASPWGTWPAPGQFFGSPSAAWQSLVGGPTTAPAASAPSGMDSIAAAALATPPGDFAGGMLPEEQRKKLLA
jgi:hypothetical protein